LRVLFPKLPLSEGNGGAVRLTATHERRYIPADFWADQYDRSITRQSLLTLLTFWPHFPTPTRSKISPRHDDEKLSEIFTVNLETLIALTTEKQAFR